MTMKRYALVDASGVVDNVVMWDGGEDWTVPAGFEAIQSDAAGVGWTYANAALSPPEPPPVQMTLPQAQAAQIIAIESAYAAAVQQPLSFTTAASVTTTFQADAASQTLLMQATQGYTIAGAVPAGFYWKAADNTLVTFTLADLQGLYSATLAQGWAAFQKRTTLKQQIGEVSIGSGTIDQGIAAVKAIIWD